MGIILLVFSVSVLFGGSMWLILLIFSVCVLFLMWAHGAHLVSFFLCVCVCVCGFGGLPAVSCAQCCHCLPNVIIVSGLFIIGYPLSAFSDVNH
jgi:hypothetical protein